MLKLIQGTAAIQKAITSIGNRGEKLDASIQLAGLSVLAHVQEHGDSTLADRLVHAMPKGGRKTALVQWMLAYGSFALLDKNDKANAQAIKDGRIFSVTKDKKADLSAAQDKCWYEFKTEGNVLDTFDVQAAVNALIKRVQSAQAKGVKMEHADKIAALTALAG